MWCRQMAAVLLLALPSFCPAASSQVIHIVTPDEHWSSVRLWKAFGQVHGAQVTVSANRRIKPDVVEILMSDDRELPKGPRAMLEPLHSEEAYCVQTFVRDAEAPSMAIWGHTQRGVMAGSAWLLTQISWKDGILQVPEILLARQPFIRGREATLCPTGRILKNKPELARRVNYELWDEAHLRKYPQFLRACGFNSIQIMELIGDERSPGYREGGDRAKIAPVLRQLADEAHKQEMSVTQYIWGSADGLHWTNPKERPDREKRYLELAATYGKDVDHIVTHWVDEGYEDGYFVPQEATAFMWNAYRKHNPKVRASLDVWGNADFWKGDAQAPQFLDATFSPTGIGVALERWYNAERAAKIHDAGRAVGIWGWYLGDYEMRCGSHLETRILDKHFGSLPKEASKRVDWISIEMCFHALPSAINLYVAGQKMWDPYRPVHDLVMEYCRSVYGSENADVMALVYETVEAGQKDVKTYGFFIPQSDRFPDVRHTVEYRAKAQKALAAIESVHLPAKWQPSFPVVGSPQQDIADLRAELQQILGETAP